MTQSMLFVARSAELKDGERRIVPHGNTEIGVYRVGDELFAYQNLCVHQGGPACEGMIMAQVEEVIAPDLTYRGMRFNHEKLHIVCPWHGWEYDLRTGEFVGDRRHRLRRFDVIEREGAIYVVL